MTNVRQNSVSPSGPSAVFFTELKSSPLGLAKIPYRSTWRRLTGSLIGCVGETREGRCMQLARVDRDGTIAQTLAPPNDVLALTAAPDDTFVCLTKNSFIRWDAKDKSRAPRIIDSFRADTFTDVVSLECISADGRHYLTTYQENGGVFLLIDTVKKTAKTTHVFQPNEWHIQPTTLSRPTATGIFSVTTIYRHQSYNSISKLLIDGEMKRIKALNIENDWSMRTLLSWPEQNVLICVNLSDHRPKFMPLNNDFPMYATTLKEIPFLKTPFIFDGCLYFCNEKNCLGFVVPPGRKDMAPGLYQTLLPYPECDNVILLDDGLMVAIKNPEQKHEYQTATVYRLPTMNQEYQMTEDILLSLMSRPVIRLIGGYAGYSMWSNSIRLSEQKPIEISFPTIEERVAKLITARKSSEAKEGSCQAKSLAALVRFELALKNNSEKEGFSYQNCFEEMQKALGVKIEELDEETQAFFKLVSENFGNIPRRKSP